ncbi:hypothetical protein ACHAXS_005445 [Conticribra weissflogii]
MTALNNGFARSLVSLVLALISHTSAFQVNNRITLSSDSTKALGMAPRFDPASQSWYPSDPEVIFMLSYSANVRQNWNCLLISVFISSNARGFRKKGLRQDTALSAAFIALVPCQ